MSSRITPSSLPEVPDAVIDRMEDRIFETIGNERQTSQGARRHRRRLAVGWTTAAAGAVVVAAIAVPLAVGNTGGMSSSAARDYSVSDAQSLAGSPEILSGDRAALDQSAGQAVDSAAGGGVAPAVGSAPDIAADPSAVGTAIITTANADLAVDSVTDALATLTDYATSLGGYVESQSVGSSDMRDPAASSADTATYGYMVLRIPAAKVSSSLTEIEKFGTLTNSSISRADVSAQKIDLQARVDSLRASVDRLTEIMAQTASVADLVAAESALSERQSTLESYEQQLTQLSDQVEMSTLSLSLTARSAVQPDTNGFINGLNSGWNGLIASLNAVIIALGFLIPWLILAAAVVLVIWLLRRRTRRRRVIAAEERAAQARAERDARDAERHEADVTSPTDDVPTGAAAND